MKKGVDFCSRANLFRHRFTRRTLSRRQRVPFQFSEFKRENPNSNENNLQIEARRLQRASVVLAVLSTPIEHPKIPKWEMVLSSGAVCMNLLSCAQSLGYAAQWLTEWYAYNNKMLEYLGGRPNIDQISGFIYLGHKLEEPMERRRPEPSKVISYL